MGWEGRGPGHPEPHSPEPSGMALTNVGSIFTDAVGFVSFPRPFSISAWNRVMMSTRVSSESRMWYRNRSTCNRHWVGSWGCLPSQRRLSTSSSTQNS